MRLFFLTPSMIGSINHRIFLLTNRQVVLMGIKRKVTEVTDKSYLKSETSMTRTNLSLEIFLISTT